jgi:hypothetical protein
MSKKKKGNTKMYIMKNKETQETDYSVYIVLGKWGIDHKAGTI